MWKSQFHYFLDTLVWENYFTSMKSSIFSYINSRVHKTCKVTTPGLYLRKMEMIMHWPVWGKLDNVYKFFMCNKYLVYYMYSINR